jgi:enterochelin esterase family protein
MESKRISAFKDAAAHDAAAATEALRADLEASRGPLAEPLEGDDERVLVTFVWIGSEGPVSLRSQAVPHEGDISISGHPLTRVDGTDVWFLSAPVLRDVRTTYTYVVDDPLATADAGELMNDFERMLELMKVAAERSYADPFNPARLYPMGGLLLQDESLTEEHWEGVLTLADTAPLPWYAEPKEQGALTDHTLVSQVFGNERQVTVYTPPGYDAGGAPYPLLVMFDGDGWLKIARVHVALDNLIGAGKIPPLVAAFSHNATSTSRMVEMACNDDQPRMLEELLSLVGEHFNVTVDPARRVLGGASYGGLATAWVGFARPDLFRNLMCSSSSFWWGYANPGAQFSFGRDGEPEWLTRQYAAAEVKPLRFWIDIGKLEGGAIPQAPHVDHVGANRHFRTVLEARGYDDVTYVETPGGHELGIWQWTFAESLPVLLRD